MRGPRNIEEAVGTGVVIGCVVFGLIAGWIVAAALLDAIFRS